MFENIIVVIIYDFHYFSSHSKKPTKIASKKHGQVEAEGKLVVGTNSTGEEIILAATAEELITQLTSKRFGKISINTLKNTVECEIETKR